MRAEIKQAVQSLGALRFFPSDEGARLEIMRLLERMVSTPEQLAWLVRTMVDEVGEWQGPKELRGVYCTRFAPGDGIDADCASGKFSPAAMEARAFEQHTTLKQLGPGASGALLPAVRP